MRTETRNGTVYVSDAVTVAAVDAAQYQQFCRAVADSTVHTVNLAAVSQADSACVTLLLAALRIKKQQQKNIQWTGLPEAVGMLMSLYEMDAWITT